MKLDTHLIWSLFKHMFTSRRFWCFEIIVFTLGSLDGSFYMPITLTIVYVVMAPLTWYADAMQRQSEELTNLEWPY